MCVLHAEAEYDQDHLSTRGRGLAVDIEPMEAELLNRLVLVAVLAAMLSPCPSGQEGGTFSFDGQTFEVSSAELSQEIALLSRLSRGNKGFRQIEQAWARVIRRKAAQHLGLTLAPTALAAMMEKRHKELRLAWMVKGEVDRDRLAHYLSSIGFSDLKSYESFCRDEFIMELFLEREFPVHEVADGEAWQRFAADNATLKVRALVFSEETTDKTVPLDFKDPNIRSRFFDWWKELPDYLRFPYDDGERPAIETEALSVVFSRYTPKQFKEFFERPREALGGDSFADRTANIEISPLHATKIRQRWQRYQRTAYGAVLRTLPRNLDDGEKFDVIRPHLEREYRMIRYLESIWLDLKGSDSIDLKAIGARTGLEWNHFPFGRIDGHVNAGEFYGDHPIHMWKQEPGLFDNITDPDNMGHARFAKGVVDQPGGHASVFVIQRAEGMRLLEPAQGIEVSRARDDFGRIFAWNEVQKTLGAFGTRLRLATQSKLPSEDITLSSVLHARGEALRSMKEIPNTQWMGPFFLKASKADSVDAIRNGPVGPRVANAVQRSIRRMLPKGALPRVGDALLPTSCNNQRVGIVAEVLGVRFPTKAQFQLSTLGKSQTESTLALERKQARTRRIQLVYAWPNIVKKFQIKSPYFDRVMAQGLMPKVPPVPHEAPPTRTETLRARLAAGRYQSLNPVTYIGQGAYNVLRFLLNPYLLQVDPDTLELLPYLAAALPDVSEDGLTHTWTLRTNARWSDGRPVTTDDVLFTWAMIQNKSVPAPQIAGAIGDVTDLRKIDAQQFTVHYKRRYFRATASFGLLVGLVPAHASPTDAAEFARTTQLIGCGPYRIERWDEKELVLDRVSNWWGEAIPRFNDSFRIRRIAHRFIDDSLQLSLQLKSGEIDVAALGGTDDYIRWKKETANDTRFDSASYFLPSWSYVGWNCEDPLFVDSKVRRAMAHLVPREEFNQAAQGGLARLVIGPFPNGSPCSDPEATVPRFSYRRAEQLLKEAGWTDSNEDGVLDREGKAFRFELIRPKGSASWMKILDVYRERLEQIGIQMTIRPVDFRAILDLGPKHDFQAYALIWRMNAVDPDVFDLFHSSQTADGNNWQNFKHKSADKLLAKYQVTTSRTDRAALGRQIHRLVMAEQPMCFLFSSPSCVVWNKRVRGVKAHRLGLREWDMYLKSDK